LLGNVRGAFTFGEQPRDELTPGLEGPRQSGDKEVADHPFDRSSVSHGRQVTLDGQAAGERYRNPVASLRELLNLHGVFIFLTLHGVFIFLTW
jgi:hypothetical protein